MFGWLTRKNGASRYVGIDMRAEGFALAVIETADVGRPTLEAVRWCAAESDEKRTAELSNVVHDLGIRGARVCATLPPASYMLVQLEPPPDMALDEMREAMRWRVGDLIDFPVEHAIIDVMPLPVSQRAGAPALVYVVVARSERVDALAKTLVEADLEVAAIDIAEMAVRNLSLHMDKPGRPRAYLSLQANQNLIEIADGSQMYLSRRVMQDFGEDADRLLIQAQMENLALEVQRSLDYFESQYAMGPADRLSVLTGTADLYAAFAEVAGAFLTVPTEQFDFDAFDLADGVEPASLRRGVGALGAAMRELSWTA